MSNPVEASIDGSTIKWAGVRSSPYGFENEPFPDPNGWLNAMSTMANYFPGSTPVGIWGVGEIFFDSINSGMDMGFPKPGGTSDQKIRFSDTDKYESYLSHFDSHGIKVFLQVEPGFADINDLIDATLRQYGHHPSVIGFGVDAEWYQSQKDGDYGVQVTDELAQAWEAKVKSYNSSYRLFLKHFDTSHLPPNYRGDIIFIDDTQEFPNKEEFLSEMKNFADFFYPNPVMYQVGYKKDEPWWQKLDTPIPKTLGQELSTQTPADQDVGVIWVDFTLKKVLPT
jgi:hypothetical protein